MKTRLFSLHTPPHLGVWFFIFIMPAVVIIQKPFSMSRFYRDHSNLHVSQQVASYKSRSVCRDFIATTATSMYPSSRHHSKAVSYVAISSRPKQNSRFLAKYSLEITNFAWQKGR
jgi:hypothetical protein